MSEFKVGDIVKLLCHPQKMIIEAQNGPLKFICVWIDDYGQPHREGYVNGVLEEYPDEDPYKKKVLDAVRSKDKDREEK